MCTVANCASFTGRGDVHVTNTPSYAERISKRRVTAKWPYVRWYQGMGSFIAWSYNCFTLWTSNFCDDDAWYGYAFDHCTV